MISYCAQGCIFEWQTVFPMEVFIFFGRKIYFPFLKCPKWVLLWRIYHIIIAKLDQIIFLNTRPYLMHNWQNGWVSKVLIHLWWKRQIPVDLVGSGSNLNCSCLIVCSLFFTKNIYSYINIYLIIEIPKKFKIQPLAWNGHARRFDCILKRA